jgi:hypothetical protein
MHGAASFIRRSSGSSGRAFVYSQMAEVMVTRSLT